MHFLPSSTTITFSTPPTPLPNDPSSLSKLIRQRHLVALQALYEQRTLQHIAQQERLALQRRQKRLAASSAEEGAAATTGALNEPETTDEAEEDPKVVEAKDRETLYKALSLVDPTSTSISSGAASSTTGPGPSSSPPPIDRFGHAYDFVYHLAPNGSSDAYYHGPHPPPPSKIVNSIMKANKNPPFFDPQGLSSTQLLPRATELFQAPFNHAATPSTSTSTLTTPLASTIEAIDSLEAELIASFSASCDERIGETLAKMEQVDREMALQRRDDARYAIGLANASQVQLQQQHQQQQQQQRTGGQMQVGTTGPAQGSGPQGAGQYGGWR